MDIPGEVASEQDSTNTLALIRKYVGDDAVVLWDRDIAPHVDQDVRMVSYNTLNPNHQRWLLDGCFRVYFERAGAVWRPRMVSRKPALTIDAVMVPGRWYLVLEPDAGMRAVGAKELNRALTLGDLS